MRHRTFTIAHYTLLEALRTRFLRISLVALVLVLLGSFFVQQLTLTESTRFQTAFFAAGSRIACVLILGLYVIGSMVREFNDKGLEIVLATSVSRLTFVAGKLVGYCGIAVLLGIAASLPLFVTSAPQSVLLWGLSLIFELWIVSASSLFCVMTLTQIAASVSFVFGFYFLARAMAAIHLVANSSLFEGAGGFHQFMSFAIGGLARILPRFDLFTQTIWLINLQHPWSIVGTLSIQTIIYVALLSAAATYDFYRRNI